jgi:hypothetical protein
MVHDWKMKAIKFFLTVAILLSTFLTVACDWKNPTENALAAAAEIYKKLVNTTVSNDEELLLHLEKFLLYAVKKADRATSKEFVEVIPSPRKKTFNELDQFVENDLAGGYCSFVSAYTSKYFRKQNVDALTIGFGIPNTNMTHVTVVVNINEKFYIFDPTWNMVFKDKEGKHIDLFTLLQTKNYEAISKPARRDWLMKKSDIDSSRYNNCISITNIRGKPAVKCNWDNYSFNDYLQNHDEYIKKHSLPSDSSLFVALLKRGMFYVKGNWATRSLFLSEWKKTGFPVH